MLAIDLSNGATQDAAMVPSSQSFDDFCMLYLDLLGVARGSHLTGKEKEMLVYMMREPEINFFAGDGKNRIMESLSLASTQLSNYKYSLARKGYVDTPSRGVAYLVPTIQHFISLARSVPVSFVFSRKIKQ